MLSALVGDVVASILCLCVVHYVLITMQSALVVYMLFFCGQLVVIWRYILFLLIRTFPHVHSDSSPDIRSFSNIACDSVCNRINM